MSALEFYNDRIIGENFVKLAAFNSDVVEAIGGLTALAERTETRLGTIETLIKRPVIVKSSKLLVLTAMGISAYAGYRYAEKKIMGSVFEAIDQGFAEAGEGFKDRRKSNSTQTDTDKN